VRSSRNSTDCPILRILCRREAVLDQIIWERPDIIGLQEVLDNQYSDLKAALPEYDTVGVGRDDGKQEGEVNSETAMLIVTLFDPHSLCSLGSPYLLSQVGRLPTTLAGLTSACSETAFNRFTLSILGLRSEFELTHVEITQLTLTSDNLLCRVANPGIWLAHAW
jgi:hypothetical protein